MSHWKTKTDQTKQDQKPSETKEDSFVVSAIKTFVIFLGFFALLYFVFGSFFVEREVEQDSTTVSYDERKIDYTNNDVPEGIPLLADEFLKQRQ